MRRAVLLLALVSCHTAPVPKDPDQRPPPEEAPEARLPEPPPPTLRLDDTLVPLRYEAKLTIDPASPTFDGVVTMHATLHRAASLVWLHADRLDFVGALVVDGDDLVPLEVVPLEADFVGLRSKTNLPAGPITLQLLYRGTFETHDSMGAFVQPVDGASYVFTQLEAIGARRVFPCVDEPWSKVPWKLELTIPAGNIAVSNTPIAAEHTLDDGQRVVVFEETPPLPTYLVAFAVGPFEIVDAGATPGGAPIRVFTFRGETALTGYVAEASAKILAILEDYFAIPYPYAKLDLVPIPTTTWFGAMENAGMITFRADILGRETWTATDKLDFAWYLAHEAAHQWFGDLVTMKWWDDLWLNEAFATWMEEKVLRAFEPTWVPDETWVQRRNNALDADGLATARMIHEPIVEAGDIQSAFDGITYQKGATVIRMVERWIGADKFQQGVQAYLRAHAHGSATSAEFIAAIDDVTDLDVAGVFATLLDQAGAPRLSASLACRDDGAATIVVAQDRWLPRGTAAPDGDHPKWELPVCVDYGDGKRRGQVCDVLRADALILSVADQQCPAWILPNADATGYYRVGLEHDALAALLDKGWGQLTGPERLLIAHDVAAMVARGDVPLGDLLALSTRLVTPKATKEALQVAAGAAWLAYGVASAKAKPAVAKWIRGTFGKRAAALGWTTKADDSLDTQQLRGTLVPLVAIAGDDAALRKGAATFSKAWPDVPEEDRVRAASAAVRDAPWLRDKLIESLRSKDHRVVRDAVSGLGGIVDPEDAKLALAALLDPEVDLTIGIGLVGALSWQREVQPIAAAFLRDHFDELKARIPEQSHSDQIWVLTASCDAADREPAEAWARAHLGDSIGFTRALANALEGLDQCVAQMAALGPELDAWLKRRTKK